MNWLLEYKKSLKNIEAEELLDIYFYRPLAFIIVKAFYSFPITPNQYSLLALFSGVISSYFLATGTEFGLRLGAFFFFLFAVLDCCDGMVARLKKNGSEFGRLIDGVVDYTVNIMVYFSLAYGLKKTPGEIFGIQPWILVVLAGISKAIHSITYDHYLNEYLSYEKGNNGFVNNELDSLKKKLNIAIENQDVLKAIALRIYIAYTTLQAGNQKKILIYNPKEYCEKNLRALKLWGVIGPAVHITFLIFAYILYVPNIMYFYAIIFGNVWLGLMFLYQFSVNKSLSNKVVS